MNSVLFRKALARAVSCMLLPLMISACTENSGQPGITNLPRQPGDDAQYGVDYRGPSPQSAEVRDFKINFWDNVAWASRCGSCHVQGQQPPFFARTDDVNLAFNEAQPFANLEDPQSSRFVTKVSGGHGCWESNTAFCAGKITEWITGWASDAGVELTKIDIRFPAVEEEQEVGPSIAFPADAGAFTQHVYPLLTDYCADCHRADAPQAPVQPYFASADPDVAYAAAQSKILLNVIEQGGEAADIDASRSRLVVRLREEAHNCWNNDCNGSANAMEAALETFAAGLPVTEADGSLLTSKAMRIADGTAISQGGRAEANAIVSYSFKEGQGTVVLDDAFDRFPPALNLNLIGNVEWVSNWGIRLNGGRAQGAVSASAKLHRYITQTGEYSIEAWVVPANVTQEGPARILGYSGSNTERNFTLGQTLYNYNFFNRSTKSNVNGSPMVATDDAAEVLQATLQHVVANFDSVNGRRLYVNGEEVIGADVVEGAVLADWDSTFALVIGNETSGEYPWAGTVRFLAIHNRVLTPEQIATNYSVGVGQKILVPFPVYEHIDGVDDAYIIFQVEQFDDYSYLFSKPTFYTRSGTLPKAVDLQGLYIGLNGREAPVGQAFANVTRSISSETFSPDGVQLSELGAVIPLEKGPDQDQFFLSFNRLDSRTVTRVEPAPVMPEEPQDLAAVPEIGVRLFAEINASLAAMTGVPVTDPAVAETYRTVEQQMPAVEELNGFLVAHQMGITQLTVKYCSVLANDAAKLAARFPDFVGRFDEAGRTAIVDPLLAALAAHEVASLGGVQLDDQPLVSDTRAELHNLFSELSPTCTQTPYTCSADSVATVITAVCAAALGSAVMLVQ